MPDWLDKINGWISKVTDVVLGLIALGVVLQILFGRNVEFLGGGGADIIGNLTGIISQLGQSGLVGLIALAILLYIYNRKS